MKLWDRIRLPYRAEQDAEVGSEAVELRTMEMIGPRPVFEPEKNLAHRSVAYDLVNTTKQDELRPRVVALRQELTSHLSPRLLNLLIVGLLLVEALAGIGVFREQGFSNPDRTIFGVMLAVGIVSLTWLSVRLGTKKPGIRRSRWFYVVVGAYGVVILSVAFLRSGGSGEESSFPIAVLMVLLTVGAAWLIEYLIRLGAPARELTRRLRTLEKELWAAEMPYLRAKATIEAIGWETERWDENAEWIRAKYLLLFRIRRAELGRMMGGPLRRV